ncbi:dTMP kinase [candidate division GN15 bacterium]|uniref:Thymidylate kinase n=1 Tax=candidate division GN15 bacterium TaxID=2072418 RepID=A0A855X5X7_9BACT|nr:MAG: dTMP kinase [candidate division GN15 bacterium]
MTAHHTGRLITFEGIDGCGKSTHIELSHGYLAQHGFKVSVLREPGSTEIAETIRAILLDRRSSMSPLTELLLYEAARADIVQKQIEPLLKRGTIVLCDRFYDSTTAYQGYGRKLDVRMVRALHRVAVGRIQPDLTLVFDLDVSAAFGRLGKDLDRLESQSRAFFRRVRAGFLEIARREKKRVKVVDATLPIAEVFEIVKRHLDNLLLHR